MIGPTSAPGDEPGPNGEEHENGLRLILQRHKAAKDRIKELEAVLEWVFDWIDDLSDFMPISADDRQPALIRIEEVLKEGEK